MIAQRLSRRACLAVTVVAFAWSPVRAQVAQSDAAGDIVVRILGEFFRRPYLAIADAAATGEVRFEIAPEGPARPFGAHDDFFASDGHALLLVRAAAAPDDVQVYRVEIRAITGVDLRTWSFTAALTPGVAARLRVGDRALIVHPPCTTQQLRDLPDIIPRPAAEGRAPDLAHESAARARSVNHLRQIGLALHNFHANYDQFPPAVIQGPDGKPWHSWRVLLLPYLEQIAVYNQYRFDEPWDGPNNIKLLDRMPDVFRDPIHGDAPTRFTHYAALVGEATAFPPSGAILRHANAPVPLPLGRGSAGSTGLRDMTDGSSNTIVVAPVAPDRQIPWTKPEDIAVGSGLPGLGRPGGIAAPYLARVGPDGHRAAPVLFADGAVRALTDTIDPEVLAALATRAGGEVIDVAALPAEPVPGRVVGVMTLRIHRDGDQVQATIEPADAGREGVPVRAPVVTPPSVRPRPGPPGSPR
jgi:hypothetical protein